MVVGTQWQWWSESKIRWPMIAAMITKSVGNEALYLSFTIQLRTINAKATVFSLLLNYQSDTINEMIE